jgi:signal transduction histidine kinase
MLPRSTNAPDSLYCELDAMSKEIKGLLRHVAADGNYSARTSNPNLLRCWEVNQCSKTACPSYGRLDNLRCWEVAGTCCHNRVQCECEIAEKIGDCRKCNVYQVARHDSLADIGESFNEMVMLIADRHQLLSATNQELVEAVECANRMAIRAEAANYAKDELLADIGHELRTPLHGILSYAKFGMEETVATGAGETLDFFRNINQCANKLLRLVNELLDLAKLEARRMPFDFQKIDFGDLVQKEIEEFWSLCVDRKVHIDFEIPDPPLIVSLDPDKIQRVISNLLSNAVKVSPPGGVIRVALERNEKTVRLSVYDEGPGIPPGELESIFDKFVRSSFVKSNTEGTGLGLAICREIVNEHRGWIWAENNAEKGSVFHSELPLEKNVSTREPVCV